MSAAGALVAFVPASPRILLVQAVPALAGLWLPR